MSKICSLLQGIPWKTFDGKSSMEWNYHGTRRISMHFPYVFAHVELRRKRSSMEIPWNSIESPQSFHVFAHEIPWKIFRGISVEDFPWKVFHGISRSTNLGPLLCRIAYRLTADRLRSVGTIDTVKCCQEYFNFDLPSVLWTKRMLKFEVKFSLYLSS